jgi:hypothetical protein
LLQFKLAWRKHQKLAASMQSENWMKSWKKTTATGAEGVCSVVEGRTGRQANWQHGQHHLGFWKLTEKWKGMVSVLCKMWNVDDETAHHLTVNCACSREVCVCSRTARWCNFIRLHNQLARGKKVAEFLDI